MSQELSLTLSPERLDEGCPEERAAFGTFVLRQGELVLTEGFDYWINGYRPGPLVSGYHLAEWIAWNWWRLRCEARSNESTWWQAHKMTAIGEGYVWPNLTIFSDGFRTTLVPHPSSRPDARPFRYTSAVPCVVPSSQFEAAIDAFIPQVLGRLRVAGIMETNLDRVWRDVLAERSDPDAAQRRRFEALLGAEPDGSDASTLEQLIRDSNTFGNDSMSEIAADHKPGGTVKVAETLRALARDYGFATSSENPRFVARTVPVDRANLPAWRLGAQAAREFREQLVPGVKTVDDSMLAELAGVPPDALTRKDRAPDISFLLDDGRGGRRTVLRSKWHTGRRFELARLIGDRLMSSAESKLFPATRSATYRQRAQRSFAAEFLAPFDAVDAELDGDYSEESRQDAAERFQVSEFAIRTLLVNHRRLEPQDIADELDTDAPSAVA